MTWVAGNGPVATGYARRWLKNRIMQQCRGYRVNRLRQGLLLISCATFRLCGGFLLLK